MKLAESEFDDRSFIVSFFSLREIHETNLKSQKLKFDKNLCPSSLNHSAITTEELMVYDLAAATRWVSTRGLMYCQEKLLFLDTRMARISIRLIISPACTLPPKRRSLRPARSDPLTPSACHSSATRLSGTSP